MIGNVVLKICWTVVAGSSEVGFGWVLAWAERQSRPGWK